MIDSGIGVGGCSRNVNVEGIELLGNNSSVLDEFDGDLIMAFREDLMRGVVP